MIIEQGIVATNVWSTQSMTVKKSITQFIFTMSLAMFFFWFQMDKKNTNTANSTKREFLMKIWRYILNHEVVKIHILYKNHACKKIIQ